jgi:6-phosphofructokinase 2
VTHQQPILTVTVNPALDLYTHVSKLVSQMKLRCSAPQIDPGGGGVNVSRVIQELGGTSTAFVAVGGATGVQLAGLLKERGISTHLFPIEGETRTSFTVMEDETLQHYRFVLPGPSQTTSREAMRRTILELVPSGGYVVITGSLLPGFSPDFYRDLIMAARDRGARTIVDAHGAELRSAVLGHPDVLRLNHIEAGDLLGDAKYRSLPELGEALLRRRVAETVLVSRTSEGTIVASPTGMHWIRPPAVQVVSSVGAGDSFVGALVLDLARGRTVVEAAAFGVAAASSAVMTEGTDLCDLEATEAMLRATTVTDLTLAAEGQPI